MYQLRIRSLLRVLWGQVCWLVLIFTATRLWMYLTFAAPEQLAGRSEDLRRMWLTGLFFDLRIAIVSLAPLLLLGFAMAAHERMWLWLRRFTPYCVGLIAFVVAAAAICNFYYYQTYHTHFDIFIFGLAEDDTVAVLGNMWEDYPLVKVFLATLVIAVIPFWLSRRALQRPVAHGGWTTPVFAGFLLVNLLLFFVMARGSVGVFPLRRSNAQVSDLVVLNKLAPNALVAIGWAFADHSKDARIEPVTYAEGVELRKATSLHDLDGHTAANQWLAENPPHVFMALLESFGSNMLAFDEAGKCDLLGSLRPHFGEDFVFRRFVPEGNGTAPSMAAIWFLSPVANVSHSSVQSIRLDFTPFAVYKKAGYRLVFIYSGNQMWRNLVNYMPVQGIDELYDENYLISRYPEAATAKTAWGVPDEYGFRLAEELLANASQPLFISMLTMTNHPPYLAPPHYRPLPVESPAFAARSEEGAKEQLNMLSTFQYAANAFGNFVTRVKQSSLGEKTLIAGTGDHQMRRIKAVCPQEQVLNWAVPFYLYVPPQILANTSYKYEPERVGAHKDVFPTLYHFSLSNITYRALGGRNMLAPEDDEMRAFGNNASVFIDEGGSYSFTDPPVIYPWHDATGLLVKETPQRQTPCASSVLWRIPLFCAGTSMARSRAFLAAPMKWQNCRITENLSV